MDTSLQASFDAIAFSPRIAGDRRRRLLLSMLVSGTALAAALTLAALAHEERPATPPEPIRRLAFVRSIPRSAPPKRAVAPQAPVKSARPKGHRPRLRAPGRTVAQALVAPSKVPVAASAAPQVVEGPVHLSTDGTDDPAQGAVGGAGVPPMDGDVAGAPDGDPAGIAIPEAPKPKVARPTKPKPIFLQAHMPRPERVSGTDPSYSQAARAAGIEGLVLVLFTISTEGEVVQARLVRSLPILGDECLRAVRSWRFNPVMLDGKAASVIVQQPFRFKLDQP